MVTVVIYGLLVFCYTVVGAYGGHSGGVCGCGFPGGVLGGRVIVQMLFVVYLLQRECYFVGGD